MASRPRVLTGAVTLGTLIAVAMSLLGCPRSLAPAPLPAAGPVSLPCPPQASPEPRAVLPVSLSLGDDVPPGRAAHIVAAATAYWRRYGVDLVVTERARTRLTAAVTDAALSPTNTHEALAQVLAPAFGFVRERAAQRSAGSAIDIVLLPRLMTPGSRATDFFTRLDGFTLSPHHRDTLVGDPEAAALYTALDLATFRPTVFLATPDAPSQPAGQADLRLAHELWHVFGLDHVGGAHRLMSTARSGATCPELDEAEQRTMQSAFTKLLTVPTR